MENKQIQTRCVQYALPDKPVAEGNEFSIGHFGKTFSFQISLNEFVTGIELLVSSEIISEETFGDRSKRVPRILSMQDVLNILTPLSVYWRKNQFPATLDEFQEQSLAVLKSENISMGAGQ